MISALTQKIKSLSNRKIFWIFSLAGLLVYADSLFNKMFWDDYDFILKNVFVHDWHFFSQYFSQNIIAGVGQLSNYWRPALLFVFSIEWHLWHNAVFGYHAVNTLIHILNAVLLFHFLAKLINQRFVAFFVAMIFLLHPVQTEAVAYVNSLGDSLSVLFMLLSGLLYVMYVEIAPGEKGRAKFLLLAVVGYILALMSKETGIVLSALLFVADFLLLDKSAGIKKKITSVLRRTWVFFAITIGYLILRATALNFDNSFNFYKEQTAYATSYFVRLLTFFGVLVQYLKLAFAPIHLVYERSTPVITSLFSPMTIIGGLLAISLLIIAVACYKKYPIVSFGLLWFFIGLAPTSNVLVPINGIMYEHWLYFPLAGLFLALIWPLWKISQTKGRLLPSALTLLLVVCLIFFGVRTIIRNRDWKDPFTFYNLTLKSNPKDLKVLNNLAVDYSKAGQCDKAIPIYNRAIGISADSDLYSNLGNCYTNLFQFDKAIESYKKSLEKNPKSYYAYSALYGVYLNQKDYPNAKATLEQWLNLGAQNEDVLIQLGKVSVAQKDYLSALEYFGRALLLDPKNKTIQDLIDTTRELKNVKY